MTESMHIVMILSSPLPPEEGIGFYAWNLAKELTWKGQRVTMITRGRIGRTWREVADGITIFRPTFWPLYPLHVYFHNLFVNRVIRELKDDIDVIHLHSPLVRFPSSEFPSLITFHTPMKADIGSISANTWLAILGKLQLPFSVWLENELIKKSYLITSVAKSVADELSAYGVDPNIVSVLGNGVDTKVFSPGNQKSIEVGKGKEYFLTAGRLGPRKGLEDLLMCARIVSERNPNMEFWIAGSGPYEKRLKSMAENLGLDEVVRFLGHISDRQEMVSLYQGAVGYIHAAHYEGLPTVLLEAMACALPIVTTAVSGALDVIEDGVNGLFAPVRDPVGLAEKALTLLGDPELRLRIGQSAYRTIQERYAWSVVGQNYLALYRELTEDFQG